MSCFNEWIGVVIFSNTSIGVGMLQGLRIFFMHHRGWWFCDFFFGVYRNRGWWLMRFIVLIFSRWLRWWNLVVAQYFDVILWVFFFFFFFKRERLTMLSLLFVFNNLLSHGLICLMEHISLAA